MSLLYDKGDFVMVGKRLAKYVGISEAIVLNQIHSWLKHFEKTAEKDYKDSDEIARHYRSGRWWVYNSYEKWQEEIPFLSASTIKRAITHLERKGILISGVYNRLGYDRTKWYTIDYQELDRVEIDIEKAEEQERIEKAEKKAKKNAERRANKECTNLTQWNGENLSVGKAQSDPTNTREYTPHISSEKTRERYSFSLKNEEKVSFDYGIFKKHIRQVCYDMNTDRMEDVVKVLVYFFEEYKKHNATGEEHIPLPDKQLRKVIDKLLCGTDVILDWTVKEYKKMINGYFITRFRKECNYRISHFMTDNVRNNLWHKYVYSCEDNEDDDD